MQESVCLFDVRQTAWPHHGSQADGVCVSLSPSLSPGAHVRSTILLNMCLTSHFGSIAQFKNFDDMIANSEKPVIVLVELCWSCVDFRGGKCIMIVLACRLMMKSLDGLRHLRRQVLVDFYATWCGPCVMMAKELSQISESMKDQVRFLCGLKP